MASTDPLKNETFNEELEALLNHAIFLGDQIKKTRSKLKSLNKMNKTADPIEENVSLIRQVQAELVNIVKDLDETTKKIATIIGTPVVDIENIELNQYDSEKHSIYPVPNTGIGILNRVPKILAPFPNSIKFGSNDELANNESFQDFLNSEEGFSPAGSCGWNFQNCKANERHNKADKNYDNDIKNTRADALNSIQNSFSTAEGKISKQDIEDMIFNKLTSTSAVEGRDKHKSILDHGEECYKQLAVKDDIIKNLTEKIKDQQKKLKKLNAKNRELEKYAPKDIERPDDELTNIEFVEKYMQRLNDKMKRKQELENIRKEAENKKEHITIEKTLRYIKELEDAEESYKQKIMQETQNKPIPDNLKDTLKDFTTSSQLEKIKTINKLKQNGGDIGLTDGKYGHEASSEDGETYNTDKCGLDKINRKKILKHRTFTSNEALDITDSENKWNENYNLGRNYLQTALGKCCRKKDHLANETNHPVESWKSSKRIDENILEANHIMGGTQEEWEKATNLLRIIEERQDAIKNMERQIEELQNLIDSEDIVSLVRARLVGDSSMDKRVVTLTSNKSKKLVCNPTTTSHTYTNDKPNSQHLLKIKRAKERELKNQSRITKLQESQAKETLAVLKDEMAKRKSQRILIHTQMSQLKYNMSQMNKQKSKNALEVETLKDKLRQMTSGIRQKREEFGDKKKLVDKLNAKIAKLERIVTKRTLC